MDLHYTFFDSFRADYPGFDQWFNRKAEETAYLCTSDTGQVVAFLYIKREGEDEDYSDINPPFRRALRLKIGTFKVISNGYKLGERFLKIVFDNALRSKVSAIYVTAFRKTGDQDRLIRVLEDWGFELHGTKGGSEQVYVRDFQPRVDPRGSATHVSYVSAGARKFIVPIYPDTTPSCYRIRSSKPNPRPNSLTTSHTGTRSAKSTYPDLIERGLKAGDLIVFYRTADKGAAYYTSVASSIGVVQEVIDGIPDLKAFVAACRKRSVFSDAELKKHWDYNPRNRPFVVNFLFVYSLPKRPNFKQLSENDVIKVAPRGFERMKDDPFERLLKVSNADTRFIVR